MTPILDGSDDGEFYDEANAWSNAASEELKEIDYPKAWHPFNVLLDIDVREVSPGMYEVRSPSHKILLNKEGFDLYRDNTPQGRTIFEDWCKRNNVHSVPRKLRDLEGTDYNG